MLAPEDCRWNSIHAFRTRYFFSLLRSSRPSSHNAQPPAAGHSRTLTSASDSLNCNQGLQPTFIFKMGKYQAG